MTKLNKATEVAEKLGLTEIEAGYSYFSQNEVSNDDLIDRLQDEFATCSYDSELFIFSDNSCINRQGDEYFINEDVDMLCDEFLTSVGYK